MKPLITVAIALLVLSNVLKALAEEPDDSRIIERILRTREAILQSAPATNSTVFLAFWDFDGTILKGDCSEGLTINGKAIYPGLAQVAIEHGLSAIYPRDGGFPRFWTDYTNMDTRIGHWLAYPFIPQMLRGARAEEVLGLSQAHFVGTLSNYLMASSVKILRALERGGVQCHILSASADLFVKGAARSLGLPVNRIHGIQVQIRDGRLSEELVYPITWNIGKRERLQEIVRELEHGPGNPKVFVLAGFGDSYNTDGPFLKFIATQSLPAGAPVAVFYDSKGPEPREYEGVFYQARHSATISGQ
jgi:phosphoserine phosphatase